MIHVYQLESYSELEQNLIECPILFAYDIIIYLDTLSGNSYYFTHYFYEKCLTKGLRQNHQQLIEYAIKKVQSPNRLIRCYMEAGKPLIYVQTIANENSIILDYDKLLRIVIMNIYHYTKQNSYVYMNDYMNDYMNNYMNDYTNNYSFETKCGYEISDYLLLEELVGVIIDGKDVTNVDNYPSFIDLYVLMFGHPMNKIKFPTPSVQQMREILIRITKKGDVELFDSIINNKNICAKMSPELLTEIKTIAGFYNKWDIKIGRAHV